MKFLNPYDLSFNQGVVKQTTVDRVKKLSKLTYMGDDVKLSVPVHFILRSDYTKDLPEFKLPYVDNGTVICDMRRYSRVKYTDLNSALTGQYKLQLFPTVALTEQIKFNTILNKDIVYKTLPLIIAEALTRTLSLDLIERRQIHTITMLFMASNYGDDNEMVSILVKKHSVGVYNVIDLTEVDTLVNELKFDGTIESYIEAIKTISTSKRMQGLDLTVLHTAISTHVTRSDILYIISALFIPALLLGVLVVYNDSAYLKQSGLYKLLKNNKRHIDISDIEKDINKLMS